MLDKEEQEKKEKDRREFIRALGVFSQLGMSMVACVIVGFLAGRFFDRLLGNNAPWLTMLFAFLGSGAAIKMVYDIAKNWK